MSQTKGLTISNADGVGRRVWASALAFAVGIHLAVGLALWHVGAAPVVVAWPAAEHAAVEVHIDERELVAEPVSPPPDSQSDVTTALAREPKASRRVARTEASVDAEPTADEEPTGESMAPDPRETRAPSTAASDPSARGVTTSTDTTGDSPVALPAGNSAVAGGGIASSSSNARPTSSGTARSPATGKGSGDDLGATATGPRLLREVNSADFYPSEARSLGREGKVVLGLELDASGSVVAARIIEKAGYGFDEAALKMIREFRFSSARTKDGRSVPFRLSYTIRFQIVD